MAIVDEEIPKVSSASRSSLEEESSDWTVDLGASVWLVPDDDPNILDRMGTHRGSRTCTGLQDAQSCRIRMSIGTGAGLCEPGASRIALEFDDTRAGRYCAESGAIELKSNGKDLGVSREKGIPMFRDAAEVSSSHRDWAPRVHRYQVCKEFSYMFRM